MFKKVRPVLSGVEGKAAALLTRGAYSQYVSTANGRPAYAKPLQQAWNRWLVSRSFSEGWRLFSTFQQWESEGWAAPSCVSDFEIRGSGLGYGASAICTENGSE